MKKKILLALLITAGMILSACSPQTTNSGEEQQQGDDSVNSDEKISIVAASFHEYDWLREILGENYDNFDVTWLMDTGVDLHSYEPSMEDISTITKSDLFIYNGGLSQSWVTELLEQSGDDSVNSLSIMESLGGNVLMEVATEGMQGGGHDHAEDDHDHAEDDHDHAEEEHDHAEDEHDHAEEEHDHAEDEHDHAEEELSGHEDEHVWLSIANAKMACETIAEEVSALDPENEAVYTENLENYLATLDTLDAEFRAEMENFTRDTLVFPDRFPFLYMMNDYGIKYYAAFQGCSTETEASFETIAFLAEKASELSLSKLLIIDNGLEQLATTVAQTSGVEGAEVMELHSMQSVSRADVDSGVTYYSIMEENLNTLTTVLSE